MSASLRRTLPVHVAAPRRLPVLGQVRDVDRVARPRYVVWEVTLRCDLACKHCGSRAGRAREGELDTAEAIDLVAQLAALGTEEITLIGGEVYLRDDWVQLVRAIRGHGIVCSIVTGGRAFSLDRARAAKDAGVQSVGVSIDGLEESHDRVRGLGSFRAAMETLASLEKVGLRRAVNTQIHRRNLREAPALLERLIGTGIYGWQVQLTVAMGRAADDADLLLEPFQMLEVVPMIAGLKARCDEAKIRLWPGSNVGYFGPHESVLRPHRRDGHGDSCPAGRSGMGVEANGDIKGCPSLPADYVGGNVREQPLRAIWERADPVRFNRGRTVDDLWGYCRDCYYNEECLGGCTWTSHVLFARRGNNPYCHHRAIELLREGKRERLVQVERPAGGFFDHGRFELVVEAWPDAARAQAERIVLQGAGFLEPEAAEPAQEIAS